jgi:hypothetical protein
MFAATIRLASEPRELSFGQPGRIPLQIGAQIGPISAHPFFETSAVGNIDLIFKISLNRATKR